MTVKPVKVGAASRTSSMRTTSSMLLAPSASTSMNHIGSPTVASREIAGTMVWSDAGRL